MTVILNCPSNSYKFIDWKQKPKKGFKSQPITINKDSEHMQLIGRRSLMTGNPSFLAHFTFLHILLRWGFSHRVIKQSNDLLKIMNLVIEPAHIKCTFCRQNDCYWRLLEHVSNKWSRVNLLMSEQTWMFYSHFTVVFWARNPKSPHILCSILTFPFIVNVLLSLCQVKEWTVANRGGFMSVHAAAQRSLIL